MTTGAETGFLALISKYIWAPLGAVFVTQVWTWMKTRGSKEQMTGLQNQVKRLEKELGDMDKQLTTLKAVTVSEDKVRDIVKENVRPIHEDQQYIKTELGKLNSTYTDLAVNIASIAGQINKKGG